MIGVVLAAFSALSYGASDFSGAVASKKHDSTLVTAAMQVVSLVTLLGVLLVFPADERTLGDLAWGALGGIGAAVALTTFYKALALGPMSSAASITAVVSAGVPVIAGLLLGDRPGAVTLIGIALAVPSAVLVSVGGVALHGNGAATPRERVAGQAHTSRTRGLALIAGLGFGLFFIALSRVSGDAGLFPLVGARVASIAALATVLTASRTWAPLSVTMLPIIVLAGLLDCAANSFYLIALDHGTFTWIAAISSLYPVSTVLLARLFLKETLAPLQIFGLALAAAALTLVAVGAEL